MMCMYIELIAFYSCAYSSSLVIFPFALINSTSAVQYSEDRPRDTFRQVASTQSFSGCHAIRSGTGIILLSPHQQQHKQQDKFQLFSQRSSQAVDGCNLFCCCCCVTFLLVLCKRITPSNSAKNSNNGSSAPHHLHFIQDQRGVWHWHWQV